MSSTSHGEAFEKRVFSYFETEIRAGRFFAKPECCTVFQHQPYYSQDRRSQIIFDLAIEVVLPGATVPSILCLIECKHYGRPVQVDDVEEFFAKVQQVAAAGAKAIIVTTSSFQSGAIEFARSKKIGLLRFFLQSDCKWELRRSPSTLSMSTTLSNDGDVWRGLTQEVHHSHRFDFYCSLGDLVTYSLNDFFRALVTEGVDANFLPAIAAEPSDARAVTFLSRDEIEDRCRSVHSIIGYKGGRVSLNAVCDWQERETGLRVDTRRAEKSEAERGILGRITFDPPSIVVFFDRIGEARQRFTLAHELGHLLLGHGSYMKAESVDESDIEKDDMDLGIDDLRHLEWQANYFASCILLPRNALMASALWQARYMDLWDRGHGLIFVDNQPGNIDNYSVFTAALMNEYAVSRTTISIRLKALGLLTDSRGGQIDAGQFSGVRSNFLTHAARAQPSVRTH
jgi:Zn-dependent peptidase ImmA (M78 family)